MKLESEPVVVGAVRKVEIPLLLRDFQAEGESPAFGLFHEAAFSTALLPTNSATEPFFLDGNRSWCNNPMTPRNTNSVSNFH
jgi:hypothetical protein